MTADDPVSAQAAPVVIGKPYHDWKDAAVRAALEGLRAEVGHADAILNISPLTRHERRRVLALIDARLGR